jgi:thymidylate kinase
MNFVTGRLSRRKDLSLQTGGLIVALVGPKASGKSTIAKELSQRLGRHLNVIRIHTGKPPPSVLSWIPNLLLPLGRKLLPHERLREYETPEKRERRDYSLFYVARMTLLAYDRRKLLRCVLRQAAAGAIVLSDRYPSETAGAIDSSCFDDAAVARCGSRLKRWMMLKERGYYLGLPKPDLVLRLEAPMGLALERDATRRKEGGPDAEAVRRRWQLERSAEFPGTPVKILSTAAPLDETARLATTFVWDAL